MSFVPLLTLPLGLQVHSKRKTNTTIRIACSGRGRESERRLTLAVGKVGGESVGASIAHVPGKPVLALADPFRATRRLGSVRVTAAQIAPDLPGDHGAGPGEFRVAGLAVEPDVPRATRTQDLERPCEPGAFRRVESHVGRAFCVVADGGGSGGGGRGGDVDGDEEGEEKEEEEEDAGMAVDGGG